MSGSAIDGDDEPTAGARRSPRTRLPELIGSQRLAMGGTLLLVVGVALLAFVAKVLDLSNGAILVIAFLGPLLAYLILTGQLSELGAGGVSLKFREAALKPVETSVQPLNVEETQAIQKLGPREMGRIDALDLEAPVVLTLTLDPRGGKYGFAALQQYLHRLEQHPRFRFVVFLDGDERAVGYLPREVLARHLETHGDAKPLLEAINSGRLPRDRSVRTEFLTLDMTTEEALSRLTALRTDAMLVRDDRRRLAGIVDRGDVLARLLLTAAQS